MRGKRGCRITLLGACLVVLGGCAASSGVDDATQGDDAARRAAGLSDTPLMSLVDSPPGEARRLHIRRALLAQHERWAGTPYRLGGSGAGGIDCSALVQNVFRDTFRFALPRTTAEQVGTGLAVARDALRPGDLVFFRPSGAYRHVGIYVGEGRFLHASTSRGVMLSELDNHYWQRHFWQARRPLEPTRLARRLVETGEG